MALSTSPASPLAGMLGASLSRQAVAAVIGSLMIAAAAQVSIGWPVPTTLQTLAIMLVAALGGLRVGTAAILLYLAQGLAGLPVFAGGGSGAGVLFGPRGGYLVGFLLATMLIGWLFDRGAGRRWLTALAALVAGEVVLFACGVAGLARFIGVDMGGVVPFVDLAAVLQAGLVTFIPVEAIKIGIALVATVGLARGLAPRRHRA